MSAAFSFAPSLGCVSAPRAHLALRAAKRRAQSALLHQRIRRCQLGSQACLPSTKSMKCSSYLSQEIESARKEARPYKIDKSKLTAADREALRLRSKAIPMVADPEPLDIVFEDENFLVVNKPSFLKMHPSHRFEGGSLLNRAIGYLGWVPWLLHRLDMHTTGVVVLSKKKELCKPIMEQFRAGKVRKEYLCVVDGVRAASAGRTFAVDAPVQRHAVKFVREIGASRADSKAARTEFAVLESSGRRGMTLLRATPRTGRTHQIRLHARECGLPIVGDDLYNATEHGMYGSYEEISEAARDERLARYGDKNALRKGLKLHAWRMGFVNPADNEGISFCAEAPEHMRKVLEWAGMRVPSCESG